ncbi:hypothetical protein [uncultured Psychroserpens sp.]|uniref:hypothetical protein n=1 Tax=uncultured Psychroserpens sp. TaxID=255436 RepID=UPI002632B303|nr:hypothetical protein [uncultured Psychroserpens sp.]
MMVYLCNIFGNQTFWPRYQYINILDVLSMLCIVAFFLIIHRIFNREPLELPVNKGENLDQYVFVFEDAQVSTKKVPLSIKIAAYIVSILLILIPLKDILTIASFQDTIWAWIF